MKTNHITLNKQPRNLYKYYPMSNLLYEDISDKSDYSMLVFLPNIKSKDGYGDVKLVEKWRAIALHGAVFYTSPIFFNDPFDTPLPELNEKKPTKKQREKYLKYIEELRREHKWHGLSKDTINRIRYADDFESQIAFIENDMKLRDVQKKYFERKLQEMRMSITEYRDELEVTCFTEKCDNKVMWSMYADRYSGFCIEYDFTEMKDVGFKKSCSKVEYSNHVINDMEKYSQKEYIGDVALNKDLTWSYEEEWRSIRIAPYSFINNKMYGFICLKDYIKTIYLGVYMKEEYKREIVDFYKDTNVKIMEMSIDVQKQSISFDEVKRK